MMNLIQRPIQIHHSSVLFTPKEKNSIFSITILLSFFVFSNLSSRIAEIFPIILLFLPFTFHRYHYFSCHILIQLLPLVYRYRFDKEKLVETENSLVFLLAFGKKNLHTRNQNSTKKTDSFRLGLHNEI